MEKITGHFDVGSFRHNQSTSFAGDRKVCAAVVNIHLQLNYIMFCRDVPYCLYLHKTLKRAL